jgi:hypothetical protein
MNKDTGLTQIKDLLQHNGPQALLQDVAAPNDAVNNWLSRLILLGDIPFQNLIADERLLPQNSLRFFYVDQSWIYALIDGALSIGTNTTLEDALTGLMAQNIKSTASFNAHQKRAKLLGIGHGLNAKAPAADKPVAGMLLRSALVTAFPGLKIIPKYAGGEDPDMQIPLRYEKLTDELLLVIFPETPVSIKLQQPPQGLQFGFLNEGIDKPYQINLRYVGDTGTGEQIPATGGGFARATIEQKDLWRNTDANNYVLNIDALAKAVKKSLGDIGADPTPAQAISPSQFVMQIIKTPQEADYITSPIK